MTVLLIVVAIALLSLVLPWHGAPGSAQLSLWATSDRDDARMGDELRFRAQSQSPRL